MADVKVVRGFVAFQDAKEITTSNGTGLAFKFKDESSGKFIDTVFWSNRFPNIESVTKGDYVILEGVGEKGSYTNKDGETKPTYSFKPFSAVVIEGHAMVKGDGGFNSGAPAEEDDPF